MPSQSRAASASQYCCTIALFCSTLTVPPWGCAPNPSALGSLAVARSPCELRSQSGGLGEGAQLAREVGSGGSEDDLGRTGRLGVLDLRPDPVGLGDPTEAGDAVAGAVHEDAVEIGDRRC